MKLTNLYNVLKTYYVQNLCNESNLSNIKTIDMVLIG